MRPPPLPHQTQVLASVLERVASYSAESGGRTALCVFDLDATLYDNRPRTLEILMEYRDEVIEAQPDVADKLSTLTADRVHYLLSDTLRACGITRSEVVADVTRYWHERFFNDAYLRHDEALDGAPEYVRACHEAGGIVVYLTGRDVSGMLLGTVSSLRESAFPFAIAGVELVLKPDASLPDEAFKRGVLPTLDRLGDVVAFFDNEPANCNLAKALFPDAYVVALDTQKVPYAPALVADVQVVADFRLV